MSVRLGISWDLETKPPRDIENIQSIIKECTGSNEREEGSGSTSLIFFANTFPQYDAMSSYTRPEDVPRHFLYCPVLESKQIHHIEVSSHW